MLNLAQSNPVSHDDVKIWGPSCVSVITETALAL